MLKILRNWQRHEMAPCSIRTNACHVKLLKDYKVNIIYYNERILSYMSHHIDIVKVG